MLDNAWQKYVDAVASWDPEMLAEKALKKLDAIADLDLRTLIRRSWTRSLTWVQLLGGRKLPRVRGGRVRLVRPALRFVASWDAAPNRGILSGNDR